MDNDAVLYNATSNFEAQLNALIFTRRKLDTNLTRASYLTYSRLSNIRIVKHISNKNKQAPINDFQQFKSFHLT